MARRVTGDSMRSFCQRTLEPTAKSEDFDHVIWSLQLLSGSVIDVATPLDLRRRRGVRQRTHRHFGQQFASGTGASLVLQAGRGGPPRGADRDRHNTIQVQPELEWERNCHLTVV